MTLYKSTAPIPLVAGTVTRLVEADPTRVALVVVADQGGANVILTPLSDIAPPFGVPATGPTPVCVHAAQYPLLAQEAWYIVASVNCNVTVYQTKTFN